MCRVYLGYGILRDLNQFFLTKPGVYDQKPLETKQMSTSENPIKHVTAHLVFSRDPSFGDRKSFNKFPVISAVRAT